LYTAIRVAAAETEHEAAIKSHCSRREIECQASIEEGKTGDDDGYHGQCRALNLPRPVLQKIFRSNAIRWIPGL
jgi:hypothetical protein